MSETVIEDDLNLGESGGASEMSGGDKTLTDAATVGVNMKTDANAKPNTGNKTDVNTNTADANTNMGDGKKTDRAQVGRSQRGKYKRGARYSSRGKGTRKGYRRGGRSKNFKKTAKDYSVDGLKSFVASIPEETKNALILFNTYLEIDNAHRKHAKEVEKAELDKKNAAKRLRDLNARQALERSERSDDKKSSDKQSANKKPADKTLTGNKPSLNKNKKPSAQEIADAETAYREAVEALNKVMSNKVQNISDQAQVVSGKAETVSDVPSTSSTP